MYSLTKEALKQYDNHHDFELMAADILNAFGYTEVVLIAPRGGSDEGKDITFTTESRGKGLACVTLRDDIQRKFEEDFSQRKAGEYEKYILFCTTYLTAIQKRKFAMYCLETLEAEFVPFDIEALRSLLDSKFPEIRERYLHIDAIRRLLLKNSIMIDDTHMSERAKLIIRDLIHRYEHWDDTEIVLPDGKIMKILTPNKKLKQARIASGLTQRAVAEKIGVEGPTVRQWEQGYPLPEDYHIQKLCELFGKTPQELGFASQ